MEKKINFSILIIFILGFIMHYLYEFLNYLVILKPFVPTSESVFEHIKLSYFPILLWWIIIYLNNKRKLNIDKWFWGLLISLCTTVILIPGLYYLYTESLGIESIAIDIFVFLISVIVSQRLGYHMYKHSPNIPLSISLIIIFLLTSSIIIFSIHPLDLPIFIEFL